METTPANTANSASSAPADTSRVREHLSNERTYLAWMRSAIALLGFSLLMLQWDRESFTADSWKLSIALAVIAIVAVYLATQHYLKAARDIEEDTYEPHDRWIVLISIVVLLLGAGMIYLIFDATAI
ncbi:DUF202 domain-containing protein [Leptolyngbya sp. FACHB-36]|uniref:YidH family protein n=1 Tax=Leptolyngbya sp. FACHB-36 TaxID=2692808 RepID=UPI0016800615|nr:DUF202 domain-containing protein [Leptolyngbya sp. FACHB-36]MBD2022221.1 DUF202 domain-containing protein [Leptolyngbya sp. FACHB-36]